MKDTFKHIADYLGTDSNTIVTIFSTILIFGLGLLFTSFGKYISKIKKRYGLRAHFKRIVKNISDSANKQSIEFKRFSDSLTFDKNFDFAINQRANPHLSTWEKLDYATNYDSFFGSFIQINGKIKRSAFDRIYTHITNIQNTEKLYFSQFVSVVDKFNTYQSNWNSSSEKIRQTYSLLVSFPMDNPQFVNFVNKFTEIIVKWQEIYPSRNLKLINEQVFPLLEKMCSDFKQFDYTQVILNAVSDSKHGYDNLNELLNAYKELFRLYYYNYRLSYKLLNKCVKMI